MYKYDNSNINIIIKYKYNYDIQFFYNFTNNLNKKIIKLTKYENVIISYTYD